ncbi:lytic transglycosylase domain-containing protein [Sphingobium sp. TCM1]|uniref:lytic transglycosylase domain-containing protein n=1 Tax=Sphingobium sp. TCM1 TaxID=453246 RepID=UPI000A00B2E7|nr:lytic transglycosylase domain-containing protein [Sphingobium sp. TCM1]
MIDNPKCLAAPAILAVLLVASQPASAAARLSPQHEARLGMCIRDAAGGRGWLEKTLWGLRDQEAGWIGAEVHNSNGSHDLGPLQINSFWVPRLAVLTGRPARDIRFWLINDPCFNVQAARWIFLLALSATGDYWKAVGAYHSPTDRRQRRYAASVSRHLAHRFGSRVFAIDSSVAQP